MEFDAGATVKVIKVNEIGVFCYLATYVYE